MTRGFTALTAVAAPLPLTNVDTDKILAAQYIKTITRAGLGSKLFSAMRFNGDGSEKPDFVLNCDPWRKAGILIARDNFGCGSSREHAPWALTDFGIQCIIAPSFADIFYNNCFKNFMLPIVLDTIVVEALLLEASDPRRCEMSVDLQTQTVTGSDGKPHHFDIDKDRKSALLNGIDEIGVSLALQDYITQWEISSSIISPEIPIDITII
ncbi:MAG: 3-isopropylmalate dehydratase small subunit [Sphingomonadales bacterium]|nr:3-isopropylmalate dehydratase small subunit [Sphingomonadales bacterium]